MLLSLPQEQYQLPFTRRIINMLSPIGFVADKGGDLPEEIIEKHRVGIVNFQVDFGEMKDIPGNTYEKIRKAEAMGIKSFVKTSQPSPKSFLDAFGEKLQEFERVICTTITSKLSGTFNSALQAKKLLGKEGDRIAVVDSQSASAGEGLFLLKALSLKEKGSSFREIVDKLKNFPSEIETILMLENIKWLRASGRIPSFVVSLLEKMEGLNVRPLFAIKNGLVKPVRLERGVEQIWQPLFREFRKRIRKIKDKGKVARVAITHGDDLKGAERLRDMIVKTEKTEIAFLERIGNVLAGLAGPGALVLSWVIEGDD